MLESIDSTTSIALVLQVIPPDKNFIDFVDDVLAKSASMREELEGKSNILGNSCKWKLSTFN